MPIIQLEDGKKQIIPTEDGKYWDEERKFSVDEFTPYCMGGEIVFMSKAEEMVD